LQAFHFLVGQWLVQSSQVVGLLVVPIEGQQVLGLEQVVLMHALGATLRLHQFEGLPAGGVPQVAVAGLVALEDELGFAIINFIEKLMPRYSDFAYEQLIKVVGG